MSTRYVVPLAADELIQIAKLVKRTERLLFTKDGAFKLDRYDGESALTGDVRIPVLRPGYSDARHTVGHLVADDGWVGFVPLGDEEIPDVVRR